MKLIFIHGPAAAGKLTIAREVCRLTGFRLFHNHITVDALLAVFQFGTPSFVRLREQIWLSVFEAAARDNISLVFTFAPESTVQPDFIQQTIDTVEREGGEVCFVELTCPIDEIERRLDAPSRAQFLKLRSIETFRRIREARADAFPPIPSSGLTIDTSTMNPEESAHKICTCFSLPVSDTPPTIQHYPEV